MKPAEVLILLTNIGWRKDNKRNILNAIVEIKDFMYHNGDSLKEAYKNSLIIQNMHQLLKVN